MASSSGVSWLVDWENNCEDYKDIFDWSIMAREMKQIATVYTDFPTKFGVPRQSGLIEELKGKIIFEPKYRQPEAFRGLEDYSHIWVLWEFSMAEREDWSATVKPPRLGGKTHVGVFATRSPFRPNPIGLSCVRLDEIEFTQKSGPVLHISGIDMADKTPVYDIKPYLPYADAYPAARGGFGEQVKNYELSVEFDRALLERIPLEKQKGAIAFLRQDPRPSHQNQPERVYKIAYAGRDIHFVVREGRLTVVDVKDAPF